MRRCSRTAVRALHAQPRLRVRIHRVALAGEYAFDVKSRLVLRTYYLPRPQDLTVLGGQIL